MGSGPGRWWGRQDVGPPDRAAGISVPGFVGRGIILVTRPENPVSTTVVRALLRHAARPASDTDADLLARFAAHRDEGAFAELVRRHGPLVRGAARRVAGHPDAADDAFQTTFLLLAGKASAGGWGPTVGPWLYRVACRVAGKARARATRRPTVSLGGDVPAPPSDPAAGMAWAEVRGALDAALAALPTRLRDPLVLCYLEGLTRDETAAALGCSPVVLKGRVARGRDRLRHALAARGLSLPAALAGTLVADGGVPAAAATALARAAVAYRATGAAPRNVQPLLRSTTGGWGLAAGLAGLLLACGAVAGLGGAGPAQEPAGPTPRIATGPADSDADPLSLGAAVRLGSADLRHPDNLTDLRFSPDGRELVSYGNGMVRRWDARTGRPVRSPARDVTPTTAWNYLTADGAALVAVHRDPTPLNRHFVRRYDPATGRHEELFALPDWKQTPPPRFAPSFILSPDGALLAAEDDDAVTLWDLRTRAPRFTIRPPSGDSSRLFTPDGAHLLTAGANGRTIRFWDVRTGKEVRSLTRAGGRLPESSLTRVVVSPDGRRVAAVDTHHLHGYGTELTIWNLDRPDRPRVLILEEGFGHGTLTFGPGGTLYTVTAPFERWLSAVSKWDAATGDRLAQWAGPHPNWRSHMMAAVSPDGAAVAVGTYSGAILLYDGRTGKELAPGGGHADGVIGVGFDPTGREVRTVGEDGSAVAWDARTGEARTRRGPPVVDRLGSAAGAIVSPDGRSVLTHGAGPIQMQTGATLWDAATGRRQVTAEVVWPSMELLPVPGGSLLVLRHHVAGGHGLQTWDTATGAVLPAIPRVFDRDQTRYAVTPSGPTLVACDHESAAGYDLRTGRERFAWKLADRGVLGRAGGDRKEWVRAVAASPDGTTLAVSVGGPAYLDAAKRTDRLVLVEAETGAVIRRAATPETAAGWLVFSPDGRWLAGPRCVWEVGTLNEVRRFPARPAVTAAGFDPAGRRVTTGHANGTAVVWPVGTD